MNSTSYVGLPEASGLATIVIAILTFFYVFYTKRYVETSSKQLSSIEKQLTIMESQSSLMEKTINYQAYALPYPKINSAKLSGPILENVYSPNLEGIDILLNFMVDVSLTNVGNSPGMNIRLYSQLLLEETESGKVELFDTYVTRFDLISNSESEENVIKAKLYFENVDSLKLLRGIDYYDPRYTLTLTFDVLCKNVFGIGFKGRYECFVFNADHDLGSLPMPKQLMKVIHKYRDAVSALKSKVNGKLDEAIAQKLKHDIKSEFSKYDLESLVFFSHRYPSSDVIKIIDDFENVVAEYEIQYRKNY